MTRQSLPEQKHVDGGEDRLVVLQQHVRRLEAIHFEIDDMQISEDLQLVVGHMIMQWLQRTAQS